MMSRKRHDKSRCKVCKLDLENRKAVDDMVEHGYSLRKIAKMLNDKDIPISYGSIFRHIHPARGREKPPEPYEQFINERSGKLFTQSLVIERKTLSELQQESKAKSVSLSIVANYQLKKWFTQKLSVPEFADTILKYRIESGWLKDGRHKYEDTVRTSITLDTNTKEKLYQLLRAVWTYAMDNQNYYREKIESQLTERQLMQRRTVLELYGLSEIINTILKLSLESFD